MQGEWLMANHGQTARLAGREEAEPTLADLMDPVALENDLNKIPGIVTVGIFANRPADVLILGTDTGIRTIE